MSHVPVHVPVQRVRHVVSQEPLQLPKHVEHEPPPEPPPEPVLEPEQLPLQEPEQLLEQALHPDSLEHEFRNGVEANKAKPNIGKAFFAASLKNCLLFWVSLLFSIVWSAKVITHFGSSGIMINVQKYTQFILFQLFVCINILYFRQNNLHKRPFA